MSETVTIVEFLTQEGAYQAGEQAAFDPDTAARMVTFGRAKIVKKGVPRLDPDMVEPARPIW